MQPGDLLAGRYRIERLLGAGGFGVVYLGTQLPLGRWVAIKLLSPSGASSSARFEQEAALAQRLDHPHTVRIIDFGFADPGFPFIVFEYLRGQTLDQLLASAGPQSPSVARRIAVQILKSLMEAHGLGVVHRDIKPPNVFITSHPGEPFFVKVLDFGIAKDTFAAPVSSPESQRAGVAKSFVPVDFTTGSGHTRASQVVGTPRYMAPEQAHGQRVGPETDLYAVGLVLSEMLTGRKVFDQDSALEILLAQGSDDPTPIPPEVVRSELGAIIVKATYKDRTARYASAAELIADLEAAYLPESTVSAATSGPQPSAPRAPGVAHTPSLPMRTLAATRVDARTPQLHAAPPIAGSGRSLAIALALIVVAVPIGWFVWAERTASPHEKRPKSDESESESEPDDTPKKKPTKNGPELPPMPKVDWAKRKVPDYDEASFKARVERSHWEIRETRTTGAPGFNTTVMLTIRRPPCSGVAYFYEFSKPEDATLIYDSLVQNGRGRALRTDTRILLAVAVRAEFPEGDPACTDPLAAALTE